MYLAAADGRFPPSPFGGRSTRMRKGGVSYSKLIKKDDLDKGSGVAIQPENLKSQRRKSSRSNTMASMSLRSLFLLGIVLAALICGIIALALGVVLTTEAVDPVNYECLSNSSELACHSKNYDSVYRLYGTKTSYHEARRFLENRTTVYIPQGCVPRFFYLISRHATRYPDEKYIIDFIEKLPMLQQRIVREYEAGNGMLCETDLANIRKWKPQMKPSDDNKISETGVLETQQLAKRFRKRFPYVLGESYSAQKYVFGFTSRNRTLSTLKAFLEGLLGEEVAATVDYERPEDDLLQFHKECKSKLKEKGVDVKSDHEEVIRFQKSKMVTDIAVRISQRVGFTVDMDEVHMMRRACVFEYSIYRDSPWCALFDTDDMKILEYGDDLDDYYSDGYGNPVNYEQACPVVRDIIHFVRGYINTAGPSVVLRFSHAGAIKKVIARFGLFKDNEPLLADDFCKQMDRKWRSSLVCPFTSNFAIVLYHCSGSGHRIGAFLQEEPVILKGCSQHPCDFNEFLGYYEPVGKNCDLDHICSAS